MFQAIVHAPELRPGARLCISDLRQTATRPPQRLHLGDDVALRFGACCPDHGVGAVIRVAVDTATLQVAGEQWRLHRCPLRGGCDVPGLISENWFVAARDA